MPASEVAPVPGVDLQALEGTAEEREAVTFEGLGERSDHVERLPRDIGYIESRSASFLICTPWTREAPPRMAAATWTASVISARFDPFSRQARV